MNYDTMNVGDILSYYIKIFNTDCVPACFTEVNQELALIESALRKAIIEEASVGVGTVRRGGEAPLPDAPQMFVPWETKDGDYDLVPKETP